MVSGVGGACCDSIIPPANAACIGSSEVTSISTIGWDSTSSPNPWRAVPKAEAIGSNEFDLTLPIDFSFFGTCSGLDSALILISFVNGPSSTDPRPESVL